MAIFDYRQLKAAGVYTMEIDNTKMPIVNISASRLLVGANPTGPFNAPVLVQNEKERIAFFGDIDTKYESLGSYFNRSLSIMLEAGPVFALNLLPTDSEDASNFCALSVSARHQNPNQTASLSRFDKKYRPSENYTHKFGNFIGAMQFANFFDRTRFWNPSSENLLKGLADYSGSIPQSVENAPLLSFGNCGTKDVSILVFKPQGLNGYDVTVREWYGGEENIPYKWLRPTDYMSDYFIQVIAFQGIWSEFDSYSADPYWSDYFTEDGIEYDKINSFMLANSVTVVGNWTGSIIPHFTDQMGNNDNIVDKINNSTRLTGILANVNEEALNVISLDKEGWHGVALCPDSEDFDPYTQVGVPFEVDLVGHSLLKNNEKGDDISFMSYVFNNIGDDTNEPDLNKRKKIMSTVNGDIYSSDLRTDFKHTSYFGSKNTILIPEQNFVTSAKNDDIRDAFEATFNYKLANTIRGDVEKLSDALNKLKTKITESKLDEDSVYNEFRDILTSFGISNNLRPLNGKIKGIDELIKSYVKPNEANLKDNSIAQEIGAFLNKAISRGLVNANSVRLNDVKKFVKNTPMAGVFANASIFDVVNRNTLFNSITTQDFLVNNAYSMRGNNPQLQNTSIPGLTHISEVRTLSFNNVKALNRQYEEEGKGKLGLTISDEAMLQYEELNKTTPIYFKMVTAIDPIFVGDPEKEEDSGGLGLGVTLYDVEKLLEDVWKNSEYKYDLNEGTKVSDFVSKYLTLIELVKTGVELNSVMDKVFGEKNISANRTQFLMQVAGLKAPIDETVAKKLPKTSVIFQKSLNSDFVHKSLKFIPLKGLNMSAKHMPGYDKNGCRNNENGLEKIYEMLMDFGINRGLTNSEMIDYRYIVDGMGFGLRPSMGGKSYLSRLAKQRGKTTALINAPSILQFEASTNPYFNDVFNQGLDVRPPFDTKYIPEGGNKQLISSNSFSLPSEEEGATYTGVFSPWLEYADGTRKVLVPPAAAVSNAFMTKFQGGDPYAVVANLNGEIKGRNIIGPEYLYDSTDRGYLEPFGINPIIRRNGRSYIYGNRTTYQRIRSDFNFLHVRELLNTIEIEIEGVLHNFVFSLNNAITRANIITLINPILSSMRNSGALYDYTISMDETPDNSVLIGDEVAVLNIGVVITKGMEKIVQCISVNKKGGVKIL